MNKATNMLKEIIEKEGLHNRGYYGIYFFKYL